MVQALREDGVGIMQIEMGAYNATNGLSLHALSQRLPNYDIYKILSGGLYPLITPSCPYSALIETAQYLNVVLLPR